MNILKLQDMLKGYSDDQLRQEMSSPSGMTPQFLVMTEMKRREEMRKEYAEKQQPTGTIAEEMAQPQPTGIAGLPDETMAGAVMRARMGGAQAGGDQPVPQPQTPEVMAAGGAVQSAPAFNSLFGGNGATNQAPMFTSLFGDNSTPAPSAGQGAGYGDIPSYTPKHYEPYKAPDYSSMFGGIFKTPRGTPNPRVHSPENEKYGLPAGMAAPTAGTPGLVTTYNKNDRATYHWANPSYRDAYIRYMTPPAKPTTTTATTAAPVAKASGGPIYASGGYYAAHPGGYEPPSPRMDPEIDMPQPREMAPWWMRLIGANMDPQIPLGVQAMNGMTGDFTAEDAADILPPVGYYMRPGIKDKAFLIPPTPRPKPNLAGANAAPAETAAKSSPVSGSRPTMPGTEPPKTPEQLQPKPSVADTPVPDYLTEYDRRMADILNRLGGSRTKQDDIDNAITQAALTIAGSTSPNVLSALTEGATAGFNSYTGARKTAKEDEARRLGVEAEALTGSTKLRADQAQNEIARRLKEQELADNAAYRKEDIAAKRERYAALMRQYKAGNDPELLVAQKIIGIGLKATDEQQAWLNKFMKDRGMTAEDVQAAATTAAVDPLRIDFEELG